MRRLFRKKEKQPSLVALMGHSERAQMLTTPPPIPAPTGVMPGFKVAPHGEVQDATSTRVPPRTPHERPAAVPHTAASARPTQAAAPAPLNPAAPAEGTVPMAGAPMVAAPSLPAAPGSSRPNEPAASYGTASTPHGAPAWAAETSATTEDSSRRGRRAAPTRLALEFSDGRRVVVGGPGVVGRAPRAGAAYRHIIRFEDPGKALSREHLGFGLTPRGLLWVSDLGSANGTLINSQPLPPGVHVPAPPGTVLRFGDYAARVVEH